jgi:hypothetical protein
MSRVQLFNPAAAASQYQPPQPFSTGYGPPAPGPPVPPPPAQQPFGQQQYAAAHTAGVYGPQSGSGARQQRPALLAEPVLFGCLGLGFRVSWPTDGSDSADAAVHH